MSWFKKNNSAQPPQTEEPVPVRNPDNVFLFRLLAVGYILYIVWKTIQLYLAGGEDAPALWMLCLSSVVLGGGAIFLGIISYKNWKKAKALLQEQAEAEAEALLDAEDAEDQPDADDAAE